MFHILLFLSLFMAHLSHGQEMSFDDEVLQELYEYRMNIEKDAYSTAKDLCSVYAHVIISSDISFSENSLDAWSKILYEGMAQPFSAIGGKKADYLEKTHAQMFELRSWFYSLYTLFLLNSDGFKKGAEECLKGHPEEVEDFIKSIKVVDIIGSSGIYLVEGGIIGKLLSVIIKSFKFVKSPVSKAYFKSLKKMHVSPRHAKNFLLTAAGSGALAGGIFFWNEYREKKAQQEMLQKWFEEELKKIEEENETETDLDK